MKTIDSPAPKNYKTPAVITYPQILNPDTGIHVVQKLTGVRYLIWYHVGKKKRYLTLPSGTTIEDARARRDNLYANLKEQYKARRVKPRDTKPRKPTALTFKPGKYIYKRQPYIARIQGKQLGEFATEQEAQAAVNLWFAGRRNVTTHTPGADEQPLKSD